MRLFIAVFLLLLFSTQAFPVSAWSKSYAKSQIAAGDDAGNADDEDSSIPKGGKAKKQNTLSEEDYDHATGHMVRVYALPAAGLNIPDRHEYLYALYSGEVTTPPPNCC